MLCRLIALLYLLLDTFFELSKLAHNIINNDAPDALELISMIFTASLSQHHAPM